MIGAYTFMALLAPAVLIALELIVLRTGLFRDVRYWAALVIGLGFQIPVDGWLTRQDNPIVIYSEQEISGLRFPMNIPVEDFGFGFALITLTLLIWRRLTTPKAAVAVDADVDAFRAGEPVLPRDERTGIHGGGGA